ncbi:hypothetical protein BC835DRAFT_1408645 [Cytidiella melzeri]|nr:hypothetical protein BC835DRAFT_1408645 [Cytidiella melzeri]
MTFKRDDRIHDDNPHEFWWTTSGGSTFIPSGTEPPSVSSSPTLPLSSVASLSTFSYTQLPPIQPSATPVPTLLSNTIPTSLSLTSGDVATITSSLPVIITQSSTTFTSFSETTLLTTGTASALPDSVTGISSLQVQPVCIGDGVDTQSLGLLSTVVVPSVIGLVLWLIFATIRPRFRQLYGLREWFVQQDLRPQPLGRSFFAFLFPHVPLIPPIPGDVSDAGKNVATDSELFPSDEALSQRALWICFLMILGWTILGLAAFLPLYMVDTPCVAHSTPAPRFTGAYSVLQDLSLLRLLRLLDNGSSAQTSSAFVLRETVDGEDRAPTARTRVIIATVLAIVLGVLPVLWKVVREFNRLVAYRERWTDVHCQGFELGWLSAESAPGFSGWGEKRVKEFIVKTGLSSTLEPNDNGNGRSRRRRRDVPEEWNNEERGNLEVDVRGLFSIGDTTQLALLIDERDEILENLEIAETKYINSFKLSTPDPSIIDFYPVPPPAQDQPPPVPPKLEISRPKPLGDPVSTASFPRQHRRRRRGRNPAYASSSLPPTSYVMPSQYYKLRGVEGVSGGHFTDAEADELGTIRRREPSLTDSFNQRVVGSRFQEVNRDSTAFGRLPIGSQLVLEKNGQMGPARLTESPLPATAPYHPQGHTSWDTAAFAEGFTPQQWWTHQPGDSIQESPEEALLGDEWVDVLHDSPEAFQNQEDYNVDSAPRRRPRPPRANKAATQDDPSRRETFPLRNRGQAEGEEQPPPHLRIQPRAPFVRPLSGLDHDDLGHIYADINVWRAKLKSINDEIALTQAECYNDIADGARIKGWLLVGRGLRYLPRVQLIEGRAKEDIRWDELQNEGGRVRAVVFWLIVVVVGIALGIGMTAVAGLAVATAPEFAHYIPFFIPLASGAFLGSGLAVCLAAAVAMTLFMGLALQLKNTPSLSGLQMLTFKTAFYVLVVLGSVWLFTIGAVLFAFDALSTAEAVSISIANGAIYMSAFAMVVLVNVAIIFPALLMLQPLRLWRVLRDEKAAITPRQRFRAVYPRSYNPSYATACCVLAVLLASAFTLIFPLVGPAAALLLFLTLVAHRFLVGYVYGRTRSQTGGLLQIWVLKRFGTLVAFQPLVLGLIFLSRRLWIEGGVLCGTALFVVVFVETYCRWRTSLPGKKSLSNVTQDSIDTFARAARPNEPREIDEESTSLVSSSRATRLRRGSFASILDMMSLTLAVMPSPSQSRGPVPLETENLDDLTATERAARTHPDAPPHLPPLPFADHAEEMAGILYAPELLAPPPVIWLPNDAGGIGRSEAFDLQRYHGLQVTMDVHSKDDVVHRRSTSPSSPRSGQATTRI